MTEDNTDPSEALDSNEAFRAAAWFLGDSLAGMPARLAAIEETAGRLALGETPGGFVMTLQDLDRLRQETEDLARFATELCEALPDPGYTSALATSLGRALRLVELRDRYDETASGGTPGAPRRVESGPPERTPESGDCLCFERPRKAV